MENSEDDEWELEMMRRAGQTHAAKNAAKAAERRKMLKSLRLEEARGDGGETGARDGPPMRSAAVIVGDVVRRLKEKKKLAEDRADSIASDLQLCNLAREAAELATSKAQKSQNDARERRAFFTKLRENIAVVAEMLEEKKMEIEQQSGEVARLWKKRGAKFEASMKLTLAVLIAAPPAGTFDDTTAKASGWSSEGSTENIFSTGSSPAILEPGMGMEATRGGKASAANRRAAAVSRRRALHSHRDALLHHIRGLLNHHDVTGAMSAISLENTQNLFDIDDAFSEDPRDFSEFQTRLEVIGERDIFNDVEFEYSSVVSFADWMAEWRDKQKDSYREAYGTDALAVLSTCVVRPSLFVYDPLSSGASWTHDDKWWVHLVKYGSSEASVGEDNAIAIKVLRRTVLPILSHVLEAGAYIPLASLEKTQMLSGTVRVCVHAGRNSMGAMSDEDKEEFLDALCNIIDRLCETFEVWVAQIKDMYSTLSGIGKANNSPELDLNIAASCGLISFCGVRLTQAAGEWLSVFEPLLFETRIDSGLAKLEGIIIKRILSDVVVRAGRASSLALWNVYCGLYPENHAQGAASAGAITALSRSLSTLPEKFPREKCGGWLPLRAACARLRAEFNAGLPQVLENSLEEKLTLVEQRLR